MVKQCAWEPRLVACGRTRLRQACGLRPSTLEAARCLEPKWLRTPKPRQSNPKTVPLEWKRCGNHNSQTPRNSPRNLLKAPLCGKHPENEHRKTLHMAAWKTYGCKDLRTHGCGKILEEAVRDSPRVKVRTFTSRHFTSLHATGRVQGVATSHIPMFPSTR